MKTSRFGTVFAVLFFGLVLSPGGARAVYECGGETDTCPCGASNFCLCDRTCGNCVWHAWHMACCEWGRALEWCTDAGTWDAYAVSNGYPTGSQPQNRSIFVCDPSGACSQWGHVGWVVTAYPDGSFDSTEQYWGGPCGTYAQNRPAGYATAGFIYNPDGPGIDDAAFDSETIPDGTHFAPGQAFTKRWTMRNTGTTTWTSAENYLWTWDGEQQFSAAEQTLLPGGTSVAPGGTWDWDVPMFAPSPPGTYRGYWRMDRYGTGRFGTRVWVEIVVDDWPDSDGDGYRADVDCDDGDASVHPGAPEVCGDGVDQDCDGQDEACVTDADGDGYQPPADCDDGDASVHPGAPEICGDGVDQDCDGADDRCEDVEPGKGVLQGVVFVDKGQGTSDISLRLPGATVAVDGRTDQAREGDAYWSFTLDPGEYSVRASYEGYEDGLRNCAIEEGERTWCSVGLFAPAPDGGPSDAGPGSDADGGQAEEEAGGCGCASNGGRGMTALLAWLVLLGLLRRRSAPSQPPPSRA